MIFASCLTHRALVPGGADQAAFFGLAISLLRDLEENCLILVDSDPARITTSSIGDVVATWPQRYRTPAKAILARLRDRKRFPNVLHYSEAPTCGSLPCRHPIGIASAYSPDAVFVAPECEASVGSLLTGPGVLTLNDYPLSRFAQQRRDGRSYRIGFGSLTQPLAERDLFDPILRYATHVTIVDRYIGRSIPDGDGTGVFGRDYQRSLAWFCEMYRKAVTLRGTQSKATLEIWSGVDMNRVSPTEATQALRQLRQWQQQIAVGVPNLSVSVKKETHLGEMPHARYLITDQAAFVIERGFDLLFSDSQMRSRGLNPSTDPRPLKDCEILLSDSARTVMAEVRRLSDVDEPT